MKNVILAICITLAGCAGNPFAGPSLPKSVYAWNPPVAADLGVTVYQSTGHDGLTDPPDFNPDHIHPNTTGQSKIAVVLGPAIQAAVAATGKI